MKASHHRVNRTLVRRRLRGPPSEIMRRVFYLTFGLLAVLIELDQVLRYGYSITS
jgi:hypothetical protein